MAGAKLTIEGLAALNQKIAGAKRSIDENTARSMNICLGVVEASAKQNCPVDTGNLRANIHIRKATNNGKEISGEVYDSAEYAGYVEFGVGIRANGTYPYKTEEALSYSPKEKWVYTPDKGNSFKTGHSRPAHPFLGKGLNDNKKRIVTIMGDSVRTSIAGGKYV